MKIFSIRLTGFYRRENRYLAQNLDLSQCPMKCFINFSLSCKSFFIVDVAFIELKVSNPLLKYDEGLKI